ncbi:hypothetical protein [Neptuniibacter sp. QD37_11]|uniref:hypothetical protein n=1 Tax=Neptuniibacter sp. QD37_11 TaxID=3398209 RepID=UPI0039F49BD2
MSQEYLAQTLIMELMGYTMGPNPEHKPDNIHPTDSLWYTPEMELMTFGKAWAHYCSNESRVLVARSQPRPQPLYAHDGEALMFDTPKQAAQFILENHKQLFERDPQHCIVFKGNQYWYDNDFHCISLLAKAADNKALGKELVEELIASGHLDRRSVDVRSVGYAQGYDF